MVTVIAGVLTLVLVAVGTALLAGGDVGGLLARLTPTGRLAAFGVLLVLMTATGWTVGSVVGPLGDAPSGHVDVHAG